MTALHLYFLTAVQILTILTMSTIDSAHATIESIDSNTSQSRAKPKEIFLNTSNMQLQLPLLIFQPNDFKETLPEWANELNHSAAEVLTTFFRGLVPDPTGNERFNTVENPLDSFKKPLNLKQDLSVLFLGVGNLRYLGGKYYYNELQGGIGVEYQFVLQSKHDPNLTTLMAFRFAPLFGELAFIRVDSAAQRDPSLPSSTFLGSALGLQFLQRIGWFEFGINGYLKPLKEITSASNSSNQDWNLAVSTAVFCRITLLKSKTHSVYLTPVFTYYNRALTGTNLDGWNKNTGPHLPATRTPNDINSFWEMLFNFEVKFR